MGLVIYVKPGCPYCQQARDHYLARGVKWTEYDAQNDRAAPAEDDRLLGRRPTVPCVVEDGRYVGSGWANPPRG